MNRIRTILLAVFALIGLWSCKKSDKISQEGQVNFSLTPGNGLDAYTLSSDTLDLVISVSSGVPDDGLNFQIEAKRSSDNSVICKIDSTAKRNTVQLKIPGIHIQKLFKLYAGVFLLIF
jgi:hypothetical protein